MSNVELTKRVHNELELRRWLRTFLGLTFPPAGVCPGHESPYAYLHHAYFEPAGDVVVWAPRGGGKTRLGAAATLLDLLHKPGCAVRILGGSFEQSLRMWEYLLPDVEYWAKDLLVGNKARSRGLRFVSGATAGVVAQSQRAVRGLRIQKLRCDEVDLFDPDVWRAAQLVTRSRPAGEGDQFGPTAGVVEALSTFQNVGGLMEQIVDDAAARDTRVIRWCLMEVLEKCPPERECAGCPLWAECGGRAKTMCNGFVTVDDAIRLKARSSVETWEAEMLCRRPNRSGCVFQTFDPKVHVVEQMPAARFDAQPNAKGEGLYLGIDFGFVNPFVCLWIRRDRWGRSFVIDELVASKVEFPQHVEAILARPHGAVRKVGCDPAGSARNEQTGLSNVQRLRRAGFKVCYRGSSIQDGLEMIRHGLRPASGEPTLFIHPRCTHLIKAMRSYHYEKGRSENPAKDGPDHAVDALRYYYVNRDAGESAVVDY